jgi:hypothetical protein
METVEGGQLTAVYDAKYKPWGETPSTGDLYQVITYAQRLGVNRAFLLYPGRGERSEVIVDRFRVAMLSIRVLSALPQPGTVSDTPTQDVDTAGLS